VRKWTTIALAFAVLGAAGYCVFQPRKGTIEYHRREYFRERDGSAIGNKVRWLWFKIRRQGYDSGEEAGRRDTRMAKHFAELERLGYLRERVFVVSNRAAEDIGDALWFILPTIFTNEVWGLGAISDVGTNTITIVAPTDEMGQWEQAIRQADVVPEK
jgi:hypothetical protein